MLEKDIENLIAKYPEELLSRLDLIFKGQQVKLGPYYADVVFEDRKGDLIIVEIKRGLIKREAIGQIIEYYGVLKQREPSRNIQLILAANVIPKEMTFLEEKLGLEFVEIPASRIREIAKRHSYRFIDSEKPELIQEYKERVEKMDIEAETGMRKVWIFQANPKRYDVLNALADESLTEDMWLVSRYKHEICAGHLGLIWMSGKEGGIYAVIDIISNPQVMYDSEQSTKYWVSEADRRQPMLRIKYRHRLKLINDPITKEELKSIPKLKNMDILRVPRGTNFKVTNDEWQIILGLLKKRYNFKE